jgi:Aspartyl/Asparaginyl beta-hydroxylase
MRIDRPLLKLPIRFDGDRLAQETAALPADAWMAHPQKFDGNVAVPLVSPGGAMTDQWAGPMEATPQLERCPYVMEVMRALDSTWGRSRLMGLDAGAVVPEHVDIHYYWRTHLRIHIPVITSPKVQFHCAGETVHMAAGECWLLDSFYRHSVENRGDELRVHLVLDTVGSEHLWALIDQALAGTDDAPLVEPGMVASGPLEFEQINAPEIMSPWELGTHIDYLLDWVSDEPRLPVIRRILDRLHMAWAGTWARHGTEDSGIPHYLRHLRLADDALAEACRPPVLMRNRWGLLDSLRRYVFANAIAPNRLSPQERMAMARPVRATA